MANRLCTAAEPAFSHVARARASGPSSRVARAIIEERQEYDGPLALRRRAGRRGHRRWMGALPTPA
eukprot:11170687-Lingulodinium_polyedra.AAC.1